MKVDEKEQLISLQEAAKLCPHSQEDLSLCARQGTLHAVKIDRTWFTTKTWLRRYIAREFISLEAAAKISPYSQEYLSLRARQGKLNAAKIGRNWFTTKKWLQAYIAQSSEYKEKVAQNQFAQQVSKIVSVRALPVPPANLPVEEIFATPLTPMPALVLDTPVLRFQEAVKFAGTFAVAVLLVGFMGIAGRGTIEETSNDARFIAEKTTSSAIAYMPAGNLSIGKGMYGAEILESVRSFHEAIAQAMYSFGERAGIRFAKEVKPLPVPSSLKKGLVVVPSTENNEEVERHVKRSFSDEVLIAPQDGDSGIITPVFRERSGEDYLYILVPLQ